VRARELKIVTKLEAGKTGYAKDWQIQGKKIRIIVAKA